MEKILNPKSVALIGSTNRKSSVGLGISQNLLQGSKKRKIFFVNPFKNKILGKKSYPSIKNIKGQIDLVIIAVPSSVVLKTVQECADKKVGGVIIVSSGFAETGKKGRLLQDKVVKVLKKSKIPLIGPNCLGIIRPASSLNASFAPAMPSSGSIGFLSQSGALVDSVIDTDLLKKYGFSFLASYGNQSDLDVCDFLEILEKDPKTKSIALYIEGLKDGKKFIEVAQRVNQKKPIVVLKAGFSKKGKKAISSHTDSLAGNYQIYQTAFKKAGIFQVETIEELLDVSLTLAWQKKCKNGIGVVTNGGACGIMSSDWCEKMNVKLPPLNKKTIKKLKNPEIMNSNFSPNNPMDIIGDALSNRYELAVNQLLQQRNIKGLIVIQTFQIMTESKKNAKIIIKSQKIYKNKPIIACFLGGKFTAKGVEILRKSKIPNIEEPRRAVLAMKSLIY